MRARRVQNLDPDPNASGWTTDNGTRTRYFQFLRPGPEICKKSLPDTSLRNHIENSVFKDIQVLNLQKFSALRSVMHILLHLFALWHID